ncbi:hypothetical protein EDD18DRAFT_1111502 [Armillaria luteobubalina]|uniref:Uncharacterized protein n=1 Tax=Armillaria luteobubalina TaxID=153913 RepID=A0AA39PKH2_9AGAR|nr:hypothetical protein EDD18DRAFT_1111502 [Armillaria luteobubalina]
MSLIHRKSEFSIIFHRTGWVFFAVLIGIILVWLYTRITIQIRTLLTFPTNYRVPSLVSRYIAKAWRFGFAPDDIDLLQYIQKVHPGRYLRSPHHEEGIGLRHEETNLGR